jgi:RNA polymerase sigma-70 factor (ECF subfamily)
LKETDLVEACKNRSPKAQRLFFDRYYNDIFQLVKRYMSQHEDIEDVVIVVFNRAFKYLNSFQYRGDGSLKKWLHTIAINESIRALDANKKVEVAQNCSDVSIQDFSDLPFDIDTVYQILQQMPAGYRQVFNLYAIDEYTHNEIAEMLGISRNTSKSQLLKARRFIIKALKLEGKHGT